MEGVVNVEWHGENYLHLKWRMVYSGLVTHVLEPWLCLCGPLHPHPPWTFMACNGDNFTFIIIIM